jgi:MoxR-like ATPase
MGFWNNLFAEERINKKLLSILDDMERIKRDLKEIRNDLDSLEIKALESRKIYKKKLSKLVGDEEKEEEETNNPLIFGR